MGADQWWIFLAFYGTIGTISYTDGHVAVVPVVSVLSILKASQEAIESRDVERNMEIVAKHYFTTNKVNSIFYHAIMETQRDFNVDFTLEDLTFIEKLIGKTQRHYEGCNTLPDGVRKSQCFYKLSDLTADLEHGVRWENVPKEQLLEEKAKLGVLYECTVVLTSHLALIATHRFRYYKSKKVSRTRMKPFLFQLEKSGSMIRNHMESMEDWLKDSVSPVSICWLKEILWQPFEKVCETRWLSTTQPRREVRNGNADDEENITKRQRIVVVPDSNNNNNNNNTKRQRIVVVPDSPPERANEESNEAFEQDYLNMEERSISRILDQLGGTKGKHWMKFRAQVTDWNKDEVFFEKNLFAEIGSRSDIMDELAGDGIAARKRRMKLLTHKLDGLGETTSITKGILYRTSNVINGWKFLL